MTSIKSIHHLRNTDGTLIELVHATRSSTQDAFREIAVPKEIIKAGKNAIRLTCSNCAVMLTKRQTCQRCKSVWYCSKDCQRKNWPTHKTLCTPVERSSGMSKLFSAVSANDVLMSALCLAAVLELDITNDKRGIGTRIPFVVAVNLGIEPTEIPDFVKLLLAQPVGSKLEGMVQFNHFCTYIPGDRYPPLEPRIMHLWNQGIAIAPEGCLVGMMEFVYNVNPQQAIMQPLPLPLVAFEAAKDKEPLFSYVSSFTGKRMDSPNTVASCLQHMNLHVRADKTNQLQLRTMMTEGDKEILRKVADKTNNEGVVYFLREKLKREDLYTDLRILL